MQARRGPSLAARTRALADVACLLGASLLAARAQAAGLRGPPVIALSASQERSLGVATAPLLSTAMRPLASTCTWSLRVSPRSTNSTKPGQAQQVSSTG